MERVNTMAIPMMRAKRMWVAKAHALSRLEVAGQAWPSSIILTKHLFGIDSDKAHKAGFDMSRAISRSRCVGIE